MNKRWRKIRADKIIQSHPITSWIVKVFFLFTWIYAELKDESDVRPSVLIC